MVHKRTLTLTDKEREVLCNYRDHAAQPQVRERCAAMVKIADGDSPYWVSQHGLLKARHPDTVYGWLNLYETEGTAGLVERLHGGKRGKWP